METLLASSVSTPNIGRVFVQEVISLFFLEALARFIIFVTRQSEMADLARRATSVCTKFYRDRLRND